MQKLLFGAKKGLNCAFWGVVKEKTEEESNSSVDENPSENNENDNESNPSESEN